MNPTEKIKEIKREIEELKELDEEGAFIINLTTPKTTKKAIDFLQKKAQLQAYKEWEQREKDIEKIFKELKKEIINHGLVNQREILQIIDRFEQKLKEGK